MVQSLMARATLSCALLLAGASVWSATPAPIPVTVTNPSMQVQVAPATPFSATVYIYIGSGLNAGGDNGNTSSGSQSFLVPAGKRLIIQTLSMYRSGGITSNSSAQIYLNASLNGNYSAYPTPLVVATGTLFPGAAQTMTVYADGGTAVLINGFRSNTSGSENIVASVSGYLVDMP